ELARLMRDTDPPIRVDAISVGLTRTIPGLTEHVRLDNTTPTALDRILTALGAHAVRRRFAGFPLGRLLNSLGPVDQGRVFWRIVRQTAPAMSALKNADIAIATDLAAAKTAWIAQRRGWVTEAYYDHRSASVGVAFDLPTSTT